MAYICQEITNFQWDLVFLANDAFSGQLQRLVGRFNILISDSSPSCLKFCFPSIQQVLRQYWNIRRNCKDYL